MRLPRLFEREAPRKRNVFKDLRGAGRRTLLVAATQSRGFDFGFATLLGQSRAPSSPLFQIRAKKQEGVCLPVFCVQIPILIQFAYTP